MASVLDVSATRLDATRFRHAVGVRIPMLALISKCTESGHVDCPIWVEKVMFGQNTSGAEIGQIDLVTKNFFGYASRREPPPQVGTSFNRKERTVATTCIRFQNLLSPLGLASQKNQKLSIKLEIDQSPPQGGKVEEFFRAEPLPFLVTHFDLPSLFATKAHALLFRGFDKGRDYYDLLFFLGRKVRPQWKLFQNAVQQTHPTHSFQTPMDLWEALRKKILTMDEKRILQDVRPFLLKPEEERFLKKDVLLLV